MFEWFKETSAAAKVLTLSGLALLLSFGLCGTAFANKVPEAIMGYFISAGIILLFAGILGVIVGTVLAIIASLRN